MAYQAILCSYHYEGKNECQAQSCDPQPQHNKLVPHNIIKMEVYPGGCHCGSIRFEATAATNFEIVKCNCSICTKKGFLHLIVPKSQFKLLQGEEHISTYTFNTGVAKHHFCSKCGISPFYIPRSNPDGFDINVRCLDSFDANKEYPVADFDGKNWEKNAASLAHLSKETPHTEF